MEKKYKILFTIVLIVIFVIVFLVIIKKFKNEPFTTPPSPSKNKLLGYDSSNNLKIIDYPKLEIGMIMIWNGSQETIPRGWSLCDGTVQNNYTTPDLRGRFVIGVGPNRYSNNISLREKIFKIPSGSETHKLTIEELPSHSHDYAYSEELGREYGNGSNFSYIAPSSTDQDLRTWEYESVADDHNNMPPYYVLCYICYTGSSSNILINNDSNNFITINYPSLPVGIIMAWNSNTIPEGWVPCEGLSAKNVYGDYIKIPDLRSRFVLSAGQGVSLTNRQFEDWGGEETITLRNGQIPGHNHTYSNKKIMSLGGTPSTERINTEDPNGVSKAPKTTYSDSSTTGGGQPHNNMPPYYALYYICYIGGGNKILNLDNKGNINVINYPLFPVGMITVWGSSIDTIPSGWVVCDGSVQNNYITPDLRNRFVIAASYDYGSSIPYHGVQNQALGYDQRMRFLTRKTLGEMNGYESIVLKINEMPAHSHNIFFLDYSVSGYGTNYGIYFGSNRTNKTSNTGGNKPHNNMPPYLPLYYICYVG